MSPRHTRTTSRRSPAWCRDEPAPASSSAPRRPPGGPRPARCCCGRSAPTSSAEPSPTPTQHPPGTPRAADLPDQASGPAKGPVMTEFIALWLRRLASPRRPGPGASPAQTAVAVLLRTACAALLAWIGYIHLHLWL